MKRNRVDTIAALTLLAVVGAASACSDAAREEPAVPASDGHGRLPETVAGYRVTHGAAAGYVPDRACADCHEEIYESYQATGMARSFYRPDPERAVEAFDETFIQPETGFHYEMSVRDGKYYQRRYCQDDAGRRFAEHEQEVAWVIGSGNHVRTYLSQNQRGEMFELPLSWYAEGGWGMSPGYEYAEHERFERQIKRECMFCHNAYPDVPRGSDLPGRAQIFPSELPHGIGCQRCHGPGARHMEVALAADSSDEDARDSIVNPADFAPGQRDQLCMTCHLQPDVHNGGESFVHVMDRSIYSHRPGQAITEAKVFFDFGPATEREQKIEINHHAYRLRQSACYTESDGELSCVTCHDPHRKQPKVERAEFYARKCLQCHQLEDCEADEHGLAATPGDCVSCHMFEARPRDVVGATITDHWIRRRPPASDLTAPLEARSRPTATLEPAPYFDDVGPRGALLDLYAGWAAADRPSKDRLRSWRASLEEVEPAVPYAYVTLGRALALAHDLDGSIEVLTDAEERFSGEASVEYNLGLSLHLAGQHAAALRHVDKALEGGAEPRTLALKGRLHALLRQVDAARAACEESLRLRSNSPKTWLTYASILAELGEMDASIAAYRQVIALNPDELEPYRMLADIHRFEGRYAEAVRVLEHGASRSDDLRLELVAVRLVGEPALRDPARALAVARAVTTRDPQSGRAHAHLALAMILNGEMDSVDVVIETARRQGVDPACCTGLLVLSSLARRDTAGLDRQLARFQAEIQTPSAERLRGPIVQLLRASLPPKQPR